jgi:multicomponent Na+:H+ antiporter subunit E
MNQNKKTKSWIIMGIFLSLMWIFIRGVSLPVSNFIIEFIFSLLFCMPIAYAFRMFFPEYTSISDVIWSIPYILLFLFIFSRDLFAANIDVAKRILDPNLPISPAIVLVHLRVKSPLAITTVANSITLTPGTLTLDYVEDSNALIVHVIDSNNTKSILDTIYIWEDYALNIFHELPSRTPLHKLFLKSHEVL